VLFFIVIVIMIVHVVCDCWLAQVPRRYRNTNSWLGYHVWYKYYPWLARIPRWYTNNLCVDSMREPSMCSYDSMSGPGICNCDHVGHVSSIGWFGILWLGAYVFVIVLYVLSSVYCVAAICLHSWFKLGRVILPIQCDCVLILHFIFSCGVHDIFQRLIQDFS